MKTIKRILSTKVRTRTDCIISFGEAYADWHLKYVQLKLIGLFWIDYKQYSINVGKQPN